MIIQGQSGWRHAFFVDHQDVMDRVDVRQAAPDLLLA